MKETYIKGYTVLKTADLNETTSNATLGHLIFGFPVTKRWKTSFGLVPYSNVGYSVIYNDENVNLGTVKYTFYGEED
ncbi:MAG: hypothetical protein R2750_13770 [Bacteroidales bacterium]